MPSQTLVNYQHSALNKVDHDALICALKPGAYTFAVQRGEIAEAGL